MIWEDKDGFLETIKDEQRFGVFLDMGLGKTSLLLALIEYKIFSEDVKNILIIMPKKVTISTWQNEIKKFENFNPLLDILQVIEGVSEERTKILKNLKPMNIHIISSSLTEWLSGETVITETKKGKQKKTFYPNKDTPNYDLIIVDECSQFKDTSSGRFKALKRLDKGQLFLLSGTPYSNVKYDEKLKRYTQPDELYYILNLLNIYKQPITEFLNSFCHKVRWNQFTWYMSPKVYEALIEAIGHHCIRKELVLDIKMNEYLIYAKVDSKRMNTLIHEYYLETNDLDMITAANRAVMINKALQLSNGFMYDNFGVCQRLNEYKYEALLDLLKHIDSTTQDNVVIFYNFKEDKKFLLDNLKGSKVYESEQDEIDWTEGKIKYLILSPFSEKYGLNLQYGGHTVIWFGLVWSGESYLQANKRVYRRGQVNDVDIYYIVTKNSFDEYVFDTLIAKKKEVKGFIGFKEQIEKIYRKG